MTEKWKTICDAAEKLPESVLEKRKLFLEAAVDPELDTETVENLLKAKCITEHEQTTLLKVIIERFYGKNEYQEAAKFLLDILKYSKETKMMFPPSAGSITHWLCEDWKPPCCF